MTFTLVSSKASPRRVRVFAWQIPILVIIPKMILRHSKLFKDPMVQLGRGSHSSSKGRPSSRRGGGGADVPKALMKPVTHLENWKGLKTLWKYSPKKPVIYHRGWEMDFRSFMVQGIDGEFNFLPEGGLDENQERVGKKRARNVPAQASKVAGDASTPLDVDSDPDIHEFPSARELKDATDCYWVGQVSGLHNEYSRLVLEEKKWEIDNLRQDRATVVTKVVPDATMKLVHSDEMGVLVTRLVKASIIHGRCVAFKEVAELKEPFVLEKMLGYRPSSKEEYDRAGDDMTNASYPFLSELTADPHASM
ncbi:hypothetical protein Tco_1069421 [Tanacetum coccineum]|uniref:Uncharacterized protein n=1 Tax=Tanacetum coccineum TaxID=301880 RepID=A0ABQ5HJW9_9ASTR